MSDINKQSRRFRAAPQASHRIMSQIYLDNAATSWPKPESVYQAVEHTMRQVGVSSGRAVYDSANTANQIVNQTRTAIASLINSPSADQIVLTTSGTDSLCTAILGLLKSGDHAVTTTADHNSVLRPLMHLQQQGTIELTIVDCDEVGAVSADEIAKAINNNTRLVAVTHASNVTGVIQPVAVIGEICQKRDVPLLIDAAQTIGHLPIDVQALGCDMLAAPGHKGLLGPMGTGFLYLSSKIVNEITPLRFGGTGSQHVDATQPTDMPQKYESGSLNVPAIAGLGEGVKFVHSEVGEALQEHVDELIEELRSGLNGIKGVKLFGPLEKSERTGVTSISIAGYDSQTVAGILDVEFEIQVRAGFHCAPLLHKALGTDQEGLIRFSLGPYNTSVDIEFAIGAIAEIAGSV